jgi:hypothetical protein
MTTTLTTDDRVSHGLLADNAIQKTTLCGRTFVAWAQGKERHGPWHGVDGPLPTLRQGREVDCMACIATRAA